MGDAVGVGFIGVGAMGAPMVARLVGAGFRVSVADGRAGRAAEVAAASGTTAAESAAAAAEGAALLITMLPTSADVAAVLCGPAGALARARPGLLVLEMSSGAPGRTREIAAAAVAAGCGLIDAPVSGGVARAVTGELAIMVGGEDEAVARAMPALSAMGSSVLRTGPVGSAHAMKALNNLVSAATFLATVEALSVGVRAGLDPARMVDILNVSSGMSNSSQKKMHPYVLTGEYASGFGLDLMVKDLRTAMEVADEAGVAPAFLGHCRATWARAAEALGPGQDHTALARYVEGETGVPLAGTRSESLTG